MHGRPAGCGTIEGSSNGCSRKKGRNRDLLKSARVTVERERDGVLGRWATLRLRNALLQGYSVIIVGVQLVVVLLTCAAAKGLVILLCVDARKATAKEGLDRSKRSFNFPRLERLLNLSIPTEAKL